MAAFNRQRDMIVNFNIQSIYGLLITAEYEWNKADNTVKLLNGSICCRGDGRHIHGIYTVVKTEVVKGEQPIIMHEKGIIW